ncbi:hypothetical protein ABBQ38_002025 [Trebouxia sp. C0009 RCD-2024]
MPELTGRQVRLQSFKPQERVQTCCRCCRRSAVKRKRITCAAYRSDLEQKDEQGKAPARSRLLSARTRPQQQAPPSRSRLFRRTETPPVPEPEEKAPRTAGRLLQRSQPIQTASNGLTRATDTVRRAQQDKGVATKEAKQTNAKHKQSDRRNVFNNPRFSQEAGKLSQKDWQVTTDWLVTNMEEGLLDDRIWRELVADCGLNPCERPQATLFHQLGMTKADFTKLVTSRRSNGLLQLRVPTIKNKLHFFRDEIGLSNEEVRKLLVKCPRILEHKLESNMRPHLGFLRSHGISKEDISKVVQSAPQMFQLSTENTLQPRLLFLKDQLGVSPEALAKILVKLPNVLTYTTQFMQERIDFLTANGMPLEDIAKAAVAHPQVLHYSVDRMQEKLQYLREIGMGQQQVAQSISRLPQLLSLDIRHNMRPKYNYLQSQMGGSVQTVCAYPAYFSLSLLQRIVPRHRYVQMVRAEPVHPFPMNYLKMSDSKFASHVAYTSLPRFESFKADILTGFRS